MLFIVVFLGFTDHPSAQNQMEPIAVNGKIDLQQWIPSQSDEIIPLNGQWEFYWKKLLSPQQLQKTSHEQIYSYAPSEWSKMSIDGEKLANTGFATYRLSIRLNPSAVNQSLALYIPASCSAYKVWLNNKEIASSGIVGTNPMLEKPWTVSHVVYLSPTSQNLELVVQISNFSQRKNGMWDSFLLGRADSITKKDNLDFSLQLIMTGSFAIMSIFYFFTFFFRRTNVMALFFSGICILLSIRLSVIDGYILRNFISDSSFVVVNKLEYISIILAMIFLIKYISHLFPNEKHPFISKTLTLIGSLYSIFILVTPVTIFTSTLYFSVCFVILVFSYHVFYVYPFAIVRKRDWALSNLIASIIVIVTVINDGFYYMGYFTSVVLAYSGFFIYYLVQIITMANQMSKAYEELEVVSNRLTELNINLENKVKERTGELKGLNEKLSASNAKLKSIEKSRREFLSNISHDLGTPMQSALGFVEMMIKGLIKENHQKYLQIVFEKLTFINKLSDDLFELTKLEENKIIYHYIEVDVGEFLKEIEKNFSLDFQRKGLLLQVELIEPFFQKEKAYIRIDTFRMEQAFQNLLQNAMKYTPKRGTVRIHAEFIIDAKKVIIHISDNGIGIDESILPEIFDRFVKVDEARTASTEGIGIGLSIAKEIVHAHNGEIFASSEKGKGSTFSIMLPVKVE